MDREVRQIAAVVSAVVLAAGVPLLVGLPLLMVSAWLNILGDHHVHQQVWGWLSTFHRHPATASQEGYTAAGVGIVPILYWISIATAYIVYQATELLAVLYRAFRYALVGA